MIKKKINVVADFETTTDPTKGYTEVWAGSYNRLYGEENCTIHLNIDDFMKDIFRIHGNVVVYFHNLKFDGSFILDYLFKKKYVWRHKEDKELVCGEFVTCISSDGKWYFIRVKRGSGFLEFRDSLKLLPFSLKKIGEDFKTKHQKLTMDYYDIQSKNTIIPADKQNYIKNDVYVLKEGLEAMFNQGMNEMTIGSCCLKDFKTRTFNSLDSVYDKTDYKNFFPDMTKIEVPQSLLDKMEKSGDFFHPQNTDAFCRKGYRGGWTYLKPSESGKIIKGGATFDANSLYSSMQHSKSGNYYPVGLPQWFEDENTLNELIEQKMPFYIRFRCAFQLKKNHLPFIQIKDSWLYPKTEHLTSSEVKLRDGRYYQRYYDANGDFINSRPFLTMNSADFDLFREQYDIMDFELMGGCYFYRILGVFDKYIDYYFKIKQNSQGAQRTIAKLMLENLYGRLASNDDSSYKQPYMEDGIVKFKLVEEHEKKTGYIPVGAYIPAYGRAFVVRFAQRNYDNFIYADTDSLHLKTPYALGLRIHNKNLLCWKRESIWDKAIFIRQKAYMERVIKDKHGSCAPRLEIKCAGMTEESKQIFLAGLRGYFKDGDDDKVFDADGNFIKRRFEDFKIGLELPGKLMLKRIKGGAILIETSYKIKENIW